MTAPTGQDLRRHPRAYVALPVLDKRGNLRPAQALTRDISRSGLYVRTRSAPLIGSRLVLQLRLPGCEVPLEVAAEVVRRDGDGMALEFIYSQEAQRVFFGARVDALVQSTQH